MAVVEFERGDHGSLNTIADIYLCSRPLITNGRLWSICLRCEVNTRGFDDKEDCSQGRSKKVPAKNRLVWRRPAGARQTDLTLQLQKNVLFCSIFSPYYSTYTVTPIYLIHVTSYRQSVTLCNLSHRSLRLCYFCFIYHR